MIYSPDDLRRAQEAAYAAGYARALADARTWMNKAGYIHVYPDLDGMPHERPAGDQMARELAANNEVHKEGK